MAGRPGGAQDMLGQGHVFSPAPLVGMRFGGRRDYTFGICERPWPCCWAVMDKCFLHRLLPALLHNFAEKQAWLVGGPWDFAEQLAAPIAHRWGPCQ